MTYIDPLERYYDADIQPEKIWRMFQARGIIRFKQIAFLIQFPVKAVSEMLQGKKPLDVQFKVKALTYLEKYDADHHLSA